MKKQIRKAPPLLTVGELKKMLDDVYDGCIVHVSGTGGVRRIEVVRGRVYIVGSGRSKGDEIFRKHKDNRNA